jgi:outer membrane protein TolC
LDRKKESEIMKFIAAIGILTLMSTVHAQTKLSFDDAVNGAVKKIEEVQAKESELRSAEIGRLQSQLRFLPDLSLTGAYSEVGADLDNRYVSRSYGLRSNWNLFRFGGDYFYYKAADSATTGLRWDLQATKIRMEETISGKALDYIASHLETEIRKKITEAQKSFFNVAEKRYSKGILSRQELDQVTIDLKNAEARLTDAQLAELQTKEALKVYMPGTEIETVWPWMNPLKKIKKKELDFSVQNHPEWQTLENKAEAADYAKKSKFSEIFPSLDFSLVYGNVRSAATNDLWAPQWVGGITLTVPLFSHLENYTAYRQSAESKLRSDLELQRSQRDLEAQWKVSENDFRVQLESALVREQTLKISNNLYQDNLRRFQAGRSTANDLLNDQERLYQSELLAIQGWKAAHVSYIRLCHALGKLVSECGL